MASVEQAQTVFVEGLGTHAHAVDRQITEHRGGDVIGIALHRHLRVSGNGVHLIYIGEQPQQVVVAQLTGRATPEIDRLYERMGLLQTDLTA